MLAPTASSPNQRRSAILALALVTALGMAACSTSRGDSGTDSSGKGAVEVAGAKAGDITPFCPKKRTKVEFVKSQGGDVYSTISGNEFMAEAKKCPNIDATWVNVTSGVQGAISATNAAIAQGVKVLVVQPDFGAAQLPSMRGAMKAGVTVMSVLAATDGVKGTDFTDQVVWSDKTIGSNQSKWLAANVKSGQIAYLGGPAGVVSSQRLFDSFKSSLAKNAPDIKIVTGNWIPTGWDPGKKRQIVAGLNAKYGKISAIVSDYAATDTGAVQGILDAKATMPAFLNIASSQGFVCLAQKNRVPWYGQDGTTGMAAVALRAGLAADQGKVSPEVIPHPLFVYSDTSVGKNPKCDPTIPPDADLSSQLSTDALKKILK